LVPNQYTLVKYVHIYDIGIKVNLSCLENLKALWR